MSRLLYVPVALLFAASMFAQKPESGAPPALTADEIMAKVAANQDRAEELRGHYVYSQHIHVVSRNSHGKLLREETTDYTVTPTATSSTHTLKRLAGRYLKGGKYLDYDKEPAPDADSTDAELVRDFRDDLTGKNTSDKKMDGSERTTKDSISKDLFPLTSAEQKQYAFRLVGRSTMQKRSVYHVVFRPKDDAEFPWAGDAYIDEQEFQPVFVATRLAKKVPFFVRTMMGTDLPGIGFSVQYERQKEGVWFPSSFGTEFYIRALYFFKRNIAVSLKNSDFAETHVDSKIMPGFSEVK